MKKIMYVLAVTLVIAGLVITSATSMPLSKNTNEYNNRVVDDVDTSIPENADTFLQRVKRLLTGEIIDVDIADTANIASSKINRSGLDADMLDGLRGNQFLRSDTSSTINGDLAVNGELTWQTKTSYISISPAAFRPHVDGYDFINDGARLRNIDGSSDVYLASVELPHGVKITNITWYWYDSSGSDGSLFMHRSDFDGVAGSIASCFSSGSSGDGSSYDNSVAGGSIDNSQYHYWLSVGLDDISIYCYGVVIEYTFTEPY